MITMLPETGTLVVYMVGGSGPPKLGCQSPDSQPPRLHCIRLGG